MKPSRGVIAIGVLSIVVGVIWGLASTYLLIFLIVEGVNLSEAGSYLGFEMLTLPIDLILAMILIISGIGVFLLKRWARSLGLIYASATLILKIIGLIITVLQGARIWPPYYRNYPIAGAIIHLIFDTMCYATPIVLLIFFSRRSVKEQFVKKSEGPGAIQMTKVEEAEEIKSILQKQRSPRFKNREEYERWKADRLHSENLDK